MNLVKNSLVFILGTFFLVVLSIQARADIDQIEIRVLPESIVYGEFFDLGDIAELDGFDVDTIRKLAKVRIGKSPLPGRSHLLQRNQIQTRLKKYSSKNRLKIILPPRSIVSRASLKIGHNQLKQIILKEIRTHFKKYKEIKITIKTKLIDVFIPKGEASYKMVRIGETANIGGYSSWMLSLILDKKEAKRLLIRAKVDVFGDVVIARGKITKGKLIGTSDLVTIRRNISRERTGYQSNPDLIAGKHARRDIQQNETLRQNLTGKPIIIQKGNPVRVILKTKNLHFTNIARAMKPGREGDMIPVRNIKSKKIIYAVIVDSKNVRVAL